MATVDVIFKVEQEHLQRFVNGLAAHYGYQDVLNDGEANPETKAQYTKRKIREEWVQRVLRQERKDLIEALVVDEIEVTD